MKNKVLSILCVILLVCTFIPLQAFASNGANVLYNNINVSNSIYVEANNDGTALISVDDLCGYFGATIMFDNNTQVLTIKYGEDYNLQEAPTYFVDIIYNFALNRNEYQKRIYATTNAVKNEIFWLNTPPKMINNKIMMSLDDVSNLFSYNYIWNSQTKVLQISNKYDSFYNTSWNSDLNYLLSSTPNFYNAITGQQGYNIEYFIPIQENIYYSKYQWIPDFTKATGIPLLYETDTYDGHIYYYDGRYIVADKNALTNYSNILVNEGFTFNITMTDLYASYGYDNKKKKKNGYWVVLYADNACLCIMVNK